MIQYPLHLDMFPSVVQDVPWRLFQRYFLPFETWIETNSWLGIGFIVAHDILRYACQNSANIVHFNVIIL